MKTFLIPLLFAALAQWSSLCFADTKISALPLGTASGVGVSDSFPYVNATANSTQRLLLDDLVNIPAFTATYAPLSSPTFSGTVTTPSLRISTGATTGYCWTATDSLGHGSWQACSGGGGGSGTVTSVGLSLPSIFSVSGSPVTSSGTLSATLASQLQNLFLSSPSGASGTPSFRAIVGADLPNPSGASLGGVQSLSCSTHQWLSQISTTGVPACTQPALSDLSGFSLSGNTTKLSTTTGTLTSGNCVKIDASGNFVDAGSACGTGGGGAVSSVGLSDGSATPIYSITGSPVTSSGTLSFTLVTQTANKVFASPNGSTGQPTFRALVGADLPAPTVSTLGGVQALTAISHNFATGINTSGQVTTAQPAFSDISGTASLTTQVTGILPVGNGGTGQSSLTSHGVVVGAGTSGVAVTTAGTSGQILTSNGASSDPTFQSLSISQVNPVTGSTGSPQSITAAGGITSTAAVPFQTQFVQGSGGPITVTAAAQISAGTQPGQIMYVIGTSDTNTLTLSDGSGLSLNGAITLYNHSVLAVIWDGTFWNELFRRI